MKPIHFSDLFNSISSIRAEKNVEERMRKLELLNRSLPDELRLEMPKFITNAYVRKALDIIEERMIQLSNGTVPN